MTPRAPRKDVVRSPDIAYGHYRLRKSGVALVWIAGCVRGGDSIVDVAKDYGVSVREARYAMDWLGARALRRAMTAKKRAGRKHAR